MDEPKVNHGLLIVLFLLILALVALNTYQGWAIEEQRMTIHYLRGICDGSMTLVR